mgnify:CR=1 FL=1
MVSSESVQQQLRDINFNVHGWGRTEAKELPHIMIADEEIYEVVNGIYEGGFALLVATNFRMLLIDKKPLNYLTVEDLRFDMISEIDYAHRLLGARINIATGSKNLRFTSYNQQRLRKLITHVQHCMADAKKMDRSQREDQKHHLKQLNNKLETYLVAQHDQQEKIHDTLKHTAQTSTDNQPAALSPELSDYLYAQGILSQYQGTKDQADLTALDLAKKLPLSPKVIMNPSQQSSSDAASSLYAEGMQEIFGNRAVQQPVVQQPQHHGIHIPLPMPQSHGIDISFDVNPLKVAYSKLPMALRNRKFGRPSFHAHSEAEPANTRQAEPASYN